MRFEWLLMLQITILPILLLIYVGFLRNEILIKIARLI